MDRKVQIHHYHLPSINKKIHMCYDWQVSGVIYEGPHILHTSKLFIQLPLKLIQLILRGGYFGHAVIYKIEPTEREASMKIYTGKLYSTGQKRLSVVNELFRDQKSTLRQLHLLLLTHALRHGFVPENFHASGMIVCLLGGGMTSEWKVKLHPSEWKQNFVLIIVCFFLSFSFSFFHL